MKTRNASSTAVTAAAEHFRLHKNCSVCMIKDVWPKEKKNMTTERNSLGPARQRQAYSGSSRLLNQMEYMKLHLNSIRQRP